MENDKKDNKFSLTGSFQKTREYVETRLRLLSLKFTERSSRLIASLLVDLTKAVFLLFALFFFSLALGFYLSEIIGSNSLGFLATGGIFVLFFVLISLLEPNLEKKLMNVSIRKFLTKWQDDNPEDLEDKKSETSSGSFADNKNARPSE